MAGEDSLDKGALQRRKARARVRWFKDKAVLCGELIIGLAQITSIVYSSEFQTAIGRAVTDGANGTDANAVEDAQQLAFAWVLPDTVYVNIIFYTLALCLFLVVTMLDGIKIVRKLSAGLIVLIALIAQCAGAAVPVVVWILALNGSSGREDALFGVAITLACIILLYFGFTISLGRKKLAQSDKLLKAARARYGYFLFVQELIKGSHMHFYSIFIFFQAFGLTKDIFFVVFFTDSIELAIVAATGFSIFLSMLTLLEVYADEEFDLRFGEFVLQIVQYLTYSVILLLLPAFYAWLWDMILVVAVVSSEIYYCGRSARGLEVEEESTVQHQAVAFLSYIVVKELEREQRKDIELGGV